MSESRMNDVFGLFFSPLGRIHRQDFWTGFLSIVLVLVIALVAVTRTVGVVFASQVMLFALEVLLAYPLYCVLAKRLQDRGRPGILGAAAVGILLLSPAAALAGLGGTEAAPSLLGQVLTYLDVAVLAAIAVDLGISPGTPGRNQYGPDPLAQS